MVVLGAFTINMIYEGCSNSFGILFTNLLDYFGDTKSNTAWIGSLFFSVPLLFGPLASRISSKLGYRTSTMVGGLIAAIGFFLGSFSTSTWMLSLSYGLISGFGMSLPYFNSTIIIANYFSKKRALANGIAECGAGIGTLVFAPLTEFLISSFGWWGGLLIMSGVVANISVCGALYRPLPLKRQEISIVHEETLTRNATAETLLTSYNMDVTLHANGNLNGHIRPEVEQAYLPCDENSTCLDNYLEKENLTTPGPPQDSNASSAGVNLHKHSKCCNLTIKSDYLKHLTSVPFIIFSIINFVMYFWYDVPYVFIVDKAINTGTNPIKATFLVSIIGIVHTVGILVFGVAGDRDFINKTLFYGISISICGLSVGLVPFFRAYEIQALLAAVFGLFSSASEAFLPMIVIDIVGLNRFDEAYGIIMFIEGVGNLIGPPLAGLICDATGAYDATFYSAGISLILSGLSYVGLPQLQKLTKKHKHCDTIIVI